MNNARTTKRDDESHLPLDIARSKRIERPGKRAAARLTLRSIREGMGATQAEVATQLGMDQGDVSKLERRPDMLLSTLRKYARAVGAECEIAFVFPKTGHRIVVAAPSK